MALELEVAEQTKRLSKAKAVFASQKPTKKAANDRRIAAGKIAAAKAKLDDLGTTLHPTGMSAFGPATTRPSLSATLQLASA